MKVKYEVSGLKELEQLMTRHLPEKIQRKATLAGMRPGVKMLTQAAQNKAPYRSHSLQLAIDMKTVPSRGTKNSSTFGAMVAGPMSGQPIAELRYAEYYRKPVPDRIRHGHLIDQGFTNWQTGEKIPGKYFMLGAFDQVSDHMIRDFRINLAKSVDRAIKRHNAKSPANRKKR